MFNAIERLGEPETNRTAYLGGPRRIAPHPHRSLQLGRTAQVRVVVARVPHPIYRSRDTTQPESKPAATLGHRRPRG